MSEEQQERLLKAARAWLKRASEFRTQLELDAYLDGVEDALTAVFASTGHGAFPAHAMREELETLFGGQDE